MMGVRKSRLHGTSGPLAAGTESVRMTTSKVMLSLCILVFSGFALIRFAVSQWRAIWISSANQPVSDSLQLKAGIDAAAVGAGDFVRLMSLCEQLSPELKESSPWLREVSIYYRAIAGLEKACNRAVPG